MIVGTVFCKEKKRREQELLRTKRRRLPDTIEGGADLGADKEVGRGSWWGARDYKYCNGAGLYDGSHLSSCNREEGEGD